MNPQVERLFGDEYEGWARAIARLALATLMPDHITIATNQQANDTWANRHQAAQLATHTLTQGASPAPV